MKVFIATPTLTGDVCHEYALALLVDGLDLERHGIGFTVSFNPGCSLISLARNDLVREFMKSGCTDLLFIDADLCWAPGAVRRVMTAKPDVVCGLYPLKQDKEGYPAHFATDEERSVKAVDGLVPLVGGPAGFMRIRRHVIELMMAAYPERAFDNGQGRTYDFFSIERSDGTLRGEDYTFCQLWRALGGEIWGDPRIDFAHVGRKAYEGNWHNYMVARNGKREHS